MGLEALQGIQNGTVPGELMEPSVTIYSSFASYVYALVWGAVNVSGVNFCKPANFLQSIIALMTVVCCILTNAVIIGSDQVGCLDGHVLTKPGTVEAAESQLAGMAGHTHDLLTGVCVLDTKTGSIQEHIDIHRLTMRALSPEEIRKYVATEYPLDCAGSYKIEGLGISLFEQIQGHDFTAITGLPLMAVCQMLANTGIHPLRGVE